MAIEFQACPIVGLLDQRRVLLMTISIYIPISTILGIWMYVFIWMYMLYHILIPLHCTPFTLYPILPYSYHIILTISITHGIHGAAIYGNMDPINIPQSC
jgi:hypothetical protein